MNKPVASADRSIAGRRSSRLRAGSGDLPAFHADMPDTLADALARAAAADAGRILLIDDVAELSVAEVQEKATKLARAMLDCAPVGCVVSFMLPNWHEAAIIYLAATMAGMVAHPILPSLRDRDVAFLLQDCNSRFIFVPREFRRFDYAEMMTRISAEMDNPPRTIVLRGEAGDFLGFDDFLGGGGAAELPSLDADDVRMIMYTSGTTGRPKGVLHSHRSMHALIAQLGEHWMVDAGDTFLVPSPISHIGGSIYAFEMPLLLGSTAILMEQWNPAQAIAIAMANGWTHMAGATPFLEQLLSAARAADSRLPDMKLFICGGASVPPQLIREAASYFEKAIVSRVYGSTETPVATVGSLTKDELNQAAETDGKAGVASVILADHAAAPSGEGEIRVRGPQMLIGYHHAEDEADAFDADGYFCTGDLGKWIDSQYLVVTGRAKDIIIRNGENISAKEVEDALIGQCGISDIAVVAIPDEKTGERAVAVIVPAQNAQPTVADLATYLVGEGMAKFKIPEQVELVANLPRNDAGKVLKEKLRSSLTA